MALVGLLSYARRYWRKGVERDSGSPAFLRLNQVMQANPRKARPKRKVSLLVTVESDSERDDVKVLPTPLGYYSVISLRAPVAMSHVPYLYTQVC